eukprot:TRINITY_DN9610_c0_g1_i1.p1 TRINITY_DN9610_c0_g1~~TRINITY_DN9610_c0_g1_i1.p1  ORF type:complete len:213 (+),score=64.97 TRINITY_DN9610_c0_g1_i1:192-830(+)
MPLHAQKSVDLLKELKVAQWLPDFNDRQIKEVVNEIKSDSREIQSIMRDHDVENVAPEDNPAPILGLLLYNDLIDQNRRCLLAYLNYRLQRVRELRWEVGLMVPEEKMGKLHDTEKIYMLNHNNILDRYMKRYVPKAKEALDLTAVWEPPEEINAKVLVKEEGLGNIVTEDSGVIKLKKGYMVYVKRTDIERLIRAGKVEHVKTCSREAAAM